MRTCPVCASELAATKYQPCVGTCIGRGLRPVPGIDGTHGRSGTSTVTRSTLPPAPPNHSDSLPSSRNSPYPLASAGDHFVRMPCTFGVAIEVSLVCWVGAIQAVMVKLPASCRAAAFATLM